MTKIKCQEISKNETENIRIRVIKAPIVNTVELRRTLISRARAVVL